MQFSLLSLLLLPSISLFSNGLATSKVVNPKQIKLMKNVRVEDIVMGIIVLTLVVMAYCNDVF
jgi:ABC-type arginine transport system permease subunit